MFNPVLSCTLLQVLVQQLQGLLAASEETLKQQQHVSGLEVLVDRLLLDVASAQQQLPRRVSLAAHASCSCVDTHAGQRKQDRQLAAHLVSSGIQC
jgi:hypothetical protein